MKLSVFIFTFLFICVNSQPVKNSIEILGDGGAKQIEQLVKNIKLDDIFEDNGDIKIYIKNIKVTSFNIGSMNLVDGGDGTYRAELADLSGSIEADVRGVKTIKIWVFERTVDASLHVKANLSNLYLSQAVKLNTVGDQLVPEVGACVSRVGDVDYEIQGKDFWGNLIAYLSNAVKIQFKGMIKKTASNKICPIVKPELQKVLDSINLNEVIAGMIGEI